MTEETKANIIKIFSAAKDKQEQLKNLAKMGFGTKAEILDVLHEEGLALEITYTGRKSRKSERKSQEVETKSQNDKTKEPPEDPKEEKKDERILPIPLDVRQFLVDQLQDVDNAIKELEEIIQEKEIEKRKLEDLYKHIVETVSR